MKVIVAILFTLFLSYSAIGQSISVEIKVYYVSWSGYVGDEYGPRFRLYRDAPYVDSSPNLLTNPCIKFGASSSGSGYPDRTVYTSVSASSPVFTLYFVSHEERKNGSDDCTSQGVSGVTFNKPDRYQPSTPDSKVIDLRDYRPGVYHQFEMNNDNVEGSYTRAIIQIRYAPLTPGTPTISGTFPADVRNNTQIISTVNQPNTDYVTYEWEYHFESEDVQNPQWASCRSSCISQCISCQGSTPGSPACNYPCSQCSIDCGSTYPQYIETWHSLNPATTNPLNFNPLQAIFSSGICKSTRVNFRLRANTFQGLSSAYSGASIYYSFEPRLSIVPTTPVGPFCGNASVNLVGTDGYGSNYKWQYVVDNGSWVNLSAFTSSSISGTLSDILGETAYKSNFGTNVKFRYTIYSCSHLDLTSGSTSNYVFYPEAPTILNYDPGPPDCPGGSNGSITINHGTILAGTSFIYSIVQYVPVGSGCLNDPAFPSPLTGYCYGGKTNATNTNGATQFKIDANNIIDHGVSFKAGTYRIKIEGSKTNEKSFPGCFTSKDFVITDPDPVTVTLSSVHAPQCKGGNDGTAALSIPKGNGSSNFTWSINSTPAQTGTSSNADRAFNISSLKTDSYTVTVTDVFCSTSDTETVSIPESTTIFDVQSSNLVKPSCYTAAGVADGSFVASVNKIGTYTTGYSFRLLDGNTSLKLSPETDLNATFDKLIHNFPYKVRAISPNGCKDSVEVTLGAPPTINGSLSATGNLCAGGTTGKILFTKTSGSSNVSLSIMKDNGTGSFQAYSATATNFEYTGLPKGTYRITATDNCLTYSGEINTKTPADIGVTAPDPMEFLTSAAYFRDDTEYPISCFDGTMDLSVGFQKGTAPYSVKLNGTTLSSNASPIPLKLGLGTYQIIVADNSACTGTADITLDFVVSSLATSPITASIVKQKYDNDKNGVKDNYNITCNERDDGKISLTVGGGVPSGSPNYKVELQNSGTKLLDNISNPTGNLDGKITGISSVFEISELAKNTEYWIKVTDSNGTPTSTEGCSKLFKLDDSGNKLIMSAPDPLDIAVPNNATDFAGLQIFGGNLYVPCKGGQDGKFTPKVSKGNPSYTISLFKRDTITDPWPAIAFRSASNITSTMPVFDFLGVGLYKVTVEDQQNCAFTEREFRIREAKKQIQVTSITAKKFSHNANTKCYGSNDGEITVKAEGGVGDYTFILTSTDGWNESHEVPGTDTYTFTSLPAVTSSGAQIVYTINVHDKINCLWTASNGVPQTIVLIPPQKVAFSWEVYSRTVSGFEIPCTGDNATIRFTSAGGKFSHSVSVTGISGTAYSTSSKPIASVTDHADFDLLKGFYRADFQDELGCSAVSQTFELRQPATHVQIQPGAPEFPVCIGGEDGKIHVGAIGGTASVTPHEYSFVVKKKNATHFDTDTLKGVSVTFLRPAAFYNSQDYSLRVIDKFKCISEADVTMPSNQTPLTLSIDTTASPSCHGGTDGFITLRASHFQYISGTALKYKLSGGHLGSTISEQLVASDTYTFTGLHGTDLEGGAYRAWIDDANFCTDTASQYTDTLRLPSYEPVGIDLIQMIRPSCYNGNDGSLYIKVSGGVAPYSYAREDGIFHNVGSDYKIFINNLTSGRYAFQVRDAQYKSDQPACQIGNSFTVSPGRFIRIEGDRHPVSCKGGADGTIVLRTYIDNRPAGETLNQSRFSVFWTHDNISSAPVANIDLTTLSKGTYTAHVSYNVDSLICANEKSLVIQEPAAQFSITEIKTYESSCGLAPDGKAIISAGGGWADSLAYYRINNSQWKKFQGSSFVIQALAPGQHTVEIAQSNFSCTDIETFTISSAKLSLAVSAVISPSCPGGTDGAVALLSPSQNVSFAIEGNSYQSLAVFDELAAGTYHFIARKNNDPSCQSGVVEAIVSNPADCGHGPLTLSLLATVPVTCAGALDGEARVMASGGVPPYLLYWDDGNIPSAEYRDHLNAGAHMVRVVDADGKEQTITFNIESLPSMLVESFTDLASCATTCDGAITLLVSGGSDQFSIQWNDSNTDFVRNNLCSNEYEFVITDANNTGCTKSGSVDVQHYPDIVITQVAAGAPICPGGTDGYLTATVSGGSGNYSLSWSNGLTSTKVENSAPGQYTLSVVDRILGCVATNSFTLPDADPISVQSTIVTAPLCHGQANGKAELVLDNVTSPLVKWQNGQIGLKATGLSSGIYRYSVTGASGCTISDTAEVPDILALAAVPETLDVTCYAVCDGKIRLTPSGGTIPYAVSWMHGPKITSLTNLCADTYRYQLSDNHGCKLSDDVIIRSPAPLTLASKTKDPSCHGKSDGMIDVSVQGGTTPYLYLWNTGQATASIASKPDGDYNIAITDAHGCVLKEDVSLNEPDAIFVNNIKIVDPSCPNSADGSIAYTVEGGTSPYHFAWENGNTDHDRLDLPSGDYTVKLTDTNACVFERSFTLKSPSQLLIANVVQTDPHCFGESNGGITLETIGGTLPLAYKWNNGSNQTSVNDIPSGTYSILVTDNKKCTVEKTFTLEDPVLPKTKGIPQTITICSGGIAAAEPEGNWSAYLWKGPDKFLSVSKKLESKLPGDYSFKAWDDKGCPTAEEKLKIVVSPNAMVADFLRISEAVAFEPIVFVDISQPLPTRLEWIVPESAAITINSQSSSTLELIFTEEGQYEIGMLAGLGNCISELYKTIDIRKPEAGRANAHNNVEDKTDDELDIVLYPNPASDHIELRIHTTSKDPIDLRLITGIDNRLIMSDIVEGYFDYLVRWDLPSGVAGVYYLIYEQHNTIRSKRIVIIK
jgi:hypothetical protein